MAAIDRVTSLLLVHWRSILLTASVIAAVGLAVGDSFFSTARIDKSMTPRPSGRSRRLRTDSWLRSRTPSDSMAVDFAKAKSHLTGDFLAYYDKFTKDIVTPTVQAKAHRADGGGASSGHIRTAPKLSRCAGIPQRNDHEQGKTRTADNSDQRADNAHEGQRFLADLEVGSIRMITLCSVDSNRHLADSAGAILIARERRYRCR